MDPTHPRPFYYLENFQLAMDWLVQRYSDVLSEDEHHFCAHFSTLPRPSQALLVRMAMRKGDHFRVSKLRYDEIGDIRAALAPLVDAGWADIAPPLDLPQLFALLTKPELIAIFGTKLKASQPKAEQLATLHGRFPPAQDWATWWPGSSDAVCRLAVRSLCTRLQWLFFGNAYQDWSEFVLADLGIFVYETVPFPKDARGFGTRAHLDFHEALQCLKERWDAGEAPHTLISDLLTMQTDAAWLMAKRDKLLFRLAQAHERAGQWAEAWAAYRCGNHPGTHFRLARVLEAQALPEQALAYAEAALRDEASEGERQALGRLHARLARRLGRPVPPRTAAPPIPEWHMQLPYAEQPVEFAVRDHLHRHDAPVYYVENLLLNGLFGLLCWPALFAPLPGAFFHPFQAGPADLSDPAFHSRRRTLFDACLAELDDGRYADSIRQRFHAKQGIQNHFVHWQVFDEALMALALACIPAPHLRLIFERMLADIAVNRAGLPDLVRFHPAERRYAMIEVKGPGDRLQDNQIRWLHHCLAHGLPVEVCYVEWQA